MKFVACCFHFWAFVCSAYLQTRIGGRPNLTEGMAIRTTVTKFAHAQAMETMSQMPPGFFLILGFKSRKTKYILESTQYDNY